MNIEQLKGLHNQLDDIRRELIKWEADTMDRDANFRVDIWLDDACEHIHLAENQISKVINYIERR